MADLVAADVTVALVTGRTAEWIAGSKRHTDVKITFGDGAKTYPALGVPLPGFASFGLRRNLESITFYDENDASALMWKFDAENNKLRAFNPGAEVLAGTAIPAQTFYAQAHGW